MSFQSRLLTHHALNVVKQLVRVVLRFTRVCMKRKSTDKPRVSAYKGAVGRIKVPDNYSKKPQGWNKTGYLGWLSLVCVGLKDRGRFQIFSSQVLSIPCG